MASKEIDKLVDDICIYHHIDNLDLMPVELQNIIKNVISEGINNPNIVKYKGLFKLYENHLFYLSRQSYLPSSSFYGAERIVYMYHPTLKKYVYLIGETHQNYTPCGSNSHLLSELLINYLKYTDKFIDVFTESSVEIKGIEYKVSNVSKSSVSILSDFSNRINNCLRLDKSKCEFKNVRFHNIDTRTFMYAYYTTRKDGDYKKLAMFMFLMNSLLTIYVLFLYNIADKSNFYQKVIELMNSQALININNMLQSGEMELKEILKSNETIKKMFLESFNKYEKLDKNLKNIKEKKVSDYIKNNLSQELDKFDFTPFIYDNLKTSINNKNNIDVLLTLILSVGEIMDLFVHFMDAYAISRLFRDYQRIDYQNSRSAIFSIVIAGDTHIKNYIKMLTDLGFEINYGLHKNNEGCITGIKQPLFGDVKNQMGV